MSNPMVHSRSSVKRWGGKVEDYISIHQIIDSPKETMNNNAARMITHNIWFCYKIIPLIFGYNITNSDGKSVDTTDIAMLHVAEDFRHKFIPTVQDYLKHMTLPDWIHNGVKVIDNPDSIKIAEDFLEKIKLEKTSNVVA